MGNLFDFCKGYNFSKGSKTAIILSKGAKNVSEEALAKACLKTKPYKVCEVFRAKVDEVLTRTVKKEEATAKKPASTSSSTRSGEPSRR